MTFKSLLRWHTIIWRIRIFFYSIRSLMYWFRIIWNDRDWDWTFIYVILEHKLKSVADHEERFGHHTTSARDAHDIRIAAELCKRIRNSYWKDPPIGPWMTRFGKWPGDPDKAPYFYQEYMEYMIEQDSAMLHDLLHKKARRWWN